jgi:hypothetical protein
MDWSLISDLDLGVRIVGVGTRDRPGGLMLVLGLICSSRYPERSSVPNIAPDLSFNVLLNNNLDMPGFNSVFYRSFYNNY